MRFGGYKLTNQQCQMVLFKHRGWTRIYESMSFGIHTIFRQTHICNVWVGLNYKCGKSTCSPLDIGISRGFFWFIPGPRSMDFFGVATPQFPAFFRAFLQHFSHTPCLYRNRAQQSTKHHQLQKCIKYHRIMWIMYENVVNPLIHHP